MRWPGYCWGPSAFRGDDYLFELDIAVCASDSPKTSLKSLALNTKRHSSGIKNFNFLPANFPSLAATILTS